MAGIQITMTGNIGQDPKLRYTPSGVAVTIFTVACHERVRDGDGEWRDGPTLDGTADEREDALRVGFAGDVASVLAKPPIEFFELAGHAMVNARPPVEHDGVRVSLAALPDVGVTDVGEERCSMRLARVMAEVAVAHSSHKTTDET